MLTWLAVDAAYRKMGAPAGRAGPDAVYRHHPRLRRGDRRVPVAQQPRAAGPGRGAQHQPAGQGRRANRATPRHLRSRARRNLEPRPDFPSRHPSGTAQPRFSDSLRSPAEHDFDELLKRFIPRTGTSCAKPPGARAKATRASTWNIRVHMAGPLRPLGAGARRRIQVRGRKAGLPERNQPRHHPPQDRRERAAGQRGRRSANSTKRWSGASAFRPRSWWNRKSDSASWWRACATTPSSCSTPRAAW